MATGQKDSEAAAFGAAPTEDARIAISATTPPELRVCAESRAGAAVRAGMEERMVSASIEVAFAREGRHCVGTGRHPPGVDLGDSFSYASVQERGGPLLFNSEDSARSDVRRAL